MALTEAGLMDRVRSVITGLGYAEAVGLGFDRQPNGNVDGVYQVRFEGEPPVGGVGFYEEARGALVIEVAHLVNDDYPAARRQAEVAGRTILNALVQDGAVASGEYAVEDAGRTFDVEIPTGRTYLIGRSRVAVNFEALLT